MSRPRTLLRAVPLVERKNPDRREIRRLWAACDTTARRPLLRWLLMTGQRIGEAQCARWNDLVDVRWSIPDDKSNRPHWIPISSGMQRLLDTLERRGEYVFQQRSATATQAWLRRWCEREGVKPPFTPHDLRRTFSTRLNAIGVAPQVAEKLLNHVMEGVLATYNAMSMPAERAAAMELWTRELEQGVGVLPDESRPATKDKAASSQAGATVTGGGTADQSRCGRSISCATR